MKTGVHQQVGQSTIYARWVDIWRSSLTTSPMPFSLETHAGLSGSSSDFPVFAWRATKMEGHFSSLRKNPAIKRLSGFLELRMMHNREHMPCPLNPKLLMSISQR